MKMKKIIAMILCIALLMLVIAGCSGPDEDIEDPDDNGTDLHEPDDDSNGTQEGIDFGAAFETFAPDTVMLRSGDLVITWEELYVILFTTVRNLVNSYGMDVPWDEDIDGQTLSELIMEYVVEEATSLLTFMYGFESTNFTFTAQELEKLNADIDGLIEAYGSKEALADMLRYDGGFFTFDVFEHLFQFEYKVMFLSDRLYGEDASTFPDERVDEFVKNNNFMMAMHILRLKNDDESDTPLNDAEEILDKLHEHIDEDDFLEYFKAIMFEFSEDVGGLQSFPNGYLFEPDDMVVNFSEATAALDIGELSDIVETEYGYHIIFRLPIDYNDVPFSLASRDGEQLSIRQLAAMRDFNNLRSEWHDALNVVRTSEFNSINLSVIFKAH